MEQQSRKEALIELFNVNQKQMILDEINIEFFKQKAANFKKGTPENVGALNQAKEKEASLFYYKILLKVIKQMIKDEDAEEDRLLHEDLLVLDNKKEVKK